MNELMTPKANELAELLGVQRALRLVEKHGGVSVYVPHTVEKDHHLHELLGEAGARKLASAYGGDRLRLPRCVRWMRRQRDDKMRAEHTTEGATAAKLARRYQMTERQVWRILSLAPPDDRQGKLL